MIKSKKLRDSARGQMCTLRLEGCNYNPETTVLAHISLKGRSGMGIKPNDFESCMGCSHCHDVIDGRVKQDFDYKDVIRAVFETQQRWVDTGLVIIK